MVSTIDLTGDDDTVRPGKVKGPVEGKVSALDSLSLRRIDARLALTLVLTAIIPS
jgi:hypothetical protein